MSGGADYLLNMPFPASPAIDAGVVCGYATSSEET